MYQQIIEPGMNRTKKAIANAIVTKKLLSCFVPATIAPAMAVIKLYDSKTMVSRRNHHKFTITNRIIITYRSISPVMLLLLPAD